MITEEERGEGVEGKEVEKERMDLAVQMALQGEPIRTLDVTLRRARLGRIIFTRLKAQLCCRNKYTSYFRTFVCAQRLFSLCM